MTRTVLVPVCAICAIVAAALATSAEPLLQNGDFSVTLEDDANWPDAWQVDEEYQGLYGWVNDDGHSDNTSLRYLAKQAAPAGPVTQTVACRPNTEYVLTAALKSDGTVLPMVRVFALDLDQVAVTVESDGDQAWTVHTARFNSGGSETLEVQLLGDRAMVQSGAATVGAAGFDDVQIYPAEEAPAEVRPRALFTPPGANLALNRPYTLGSAPRYSYCTDPDDATQLTDGVYTVGYFWTQKTTVGWSSTMPVVITVDLGEVQPIAGLSYSTAAGVAGVAWPSAITVLVSDDAEEWTLLGDLVRMSAEEIGPPPDTYATHRFAGLALSTRGRYVKFFVAQIPYTFVDEIEVYRGPDELLAVEPEGRAVADPMEFFRESRVFSAMRVRLGTDLAGARDALRSARLDRPERDRSLAEADALAAEIEALPFGVPPDFRTILPFSDLHARIYALNAPVLRARGFRPLTAWAHNRWDMLVPTQAPEGPPASAPALSVRMMRNEYRAAAFNLTNSTDGELALTLNIQGLPGGANPEYVSVREVLFTDTASGTVLAAALPRARLDRRGYRISVPAGMTRQVWLSLHPTDLDAGRHEGQITVQAGRGIADITVPLTLHLYPFDFPELPSIAIGGWDYTETTGAYDARVTDLAEFIGALREHYVDTPWASGGAAPRGGDFDADGRLTGDLDFTTWDGWLDKWPGARNYCVYLSVGDSFRGEPMGTERFNRMVGEWTTAWVDHLEAQGLQPDQLGLLLVDEPTRPEQDEIILAWARAISAAQPEVVIWEDPCHADPVSANQEMIAACTVLCPNTPRFMSADQAYRDYFDAQRDAGRELWFYSCNAGKRADPTTYHRGQFWWAIKYGAKGSCYWAFGDEGGGGSSFNAYLIPGTAYSPLFLDPSGITDGKHMEAIREGAEDYEYFVMLRDRVTELEAQGVAAPALTEARELLATAPDRVVGGITRENLAWEVPKDRGVMDRTRVQVLELLLELSEL